MLIARTDVECHLWARVSGNLPDKHYISLVRRGLRTMKATYHCFNVYTDIEQLEPGDTYIHKFHILGMSYQETRYFFYLGQIGGFDSPSQTCIFELKSLWKQSYLQEGYESASPRFLAYSYYRPQAQTYTPTMTFDVTQIRLRLLCNPFGHASIIQALTTFADGSPGAYVLSEVTYPNWPPDWVDGLLAFRYIVMPRFRVVAGSKIAFAIWGDPAWPWQDQGAWGRDAFDDDYPGGDAFCGWFDPPNAYWRKYPYPGAPWFDALDFRFRAEGFPPGG